VRRGEEGRARDLRRAGRRGPAPGVRPNLIEDVLP
jgi:hypothetical protein